MTDLPDGMKSYLELERSLDEYARAANEALGSGGARFALFKAAYKQQFSPGAADAIVWAILGDILVLYYLGLTPSVIVELHATLEHYARRDLPYLITSKKESCGVVKQLVERRTLSELSKMLVTIGVWSNEDSAFMSRLAKLRNGIAHNNEASLGRALGGQEYQHINDARLAVAEIDVLPYVMSTIVALVKLATA